MKKRAHSESIAQDLREQMERLASEMAAQAMLLDNPPDAPEAVHKIRTIAKKLRALLELVGPDWGRIAAERVRRRVSKIKDSVAMARDADVMSALGAEFSGLTIRFPRKATRSTASKIAQLTEALKTALAQFDYAEISRKKCCRRAGASFQKAQKQFLECLGDPSDERLHKWRKRVKRLHYQTGTLHSDEDEFASATKKLSGLLGDHQDYCVLQAHLKGSARRVHGEIQRRKQEVRRSALEAGADIFQSPVDSKRDFSSP